MSIGICHCHCLCICLCLCCCLKMTNRWLHLNLEYLNLTEYLFILSWTDDISKLLLHWAVSGEEEDQRDQYDGNAGQLSMVLFYLCLQEQIFWGPSLVSCPGKVWGQLDRWQFHSLTALSDFWYDTVQGWGQDSVPKMGESESGQITSEMRIIWWNHAKIQQNGQLHCSDFTKRRLNNSMQIVLIDPCDRRLGRHRLPQLFQ